MTTIPQHFNEPLEIELISLPSGSPSEVHITQDNPGFKRADLIMIDTERIPEVIATLQALSGEKGELDSFVEFCIDNLIIPKNDDWEQVVSKFKQSKQK